MEQALGLSYETATMFAIMVALGIAGIAALFMALFWPRRWHVPYRLEIVFAALLAALVVYADWSSARIYRAYEQDLPRVATAGKLEPGASTSAFDRTVAVYSYQWGFVFIDTDGVGSRNAMVARPGEKILFNLLSNDVIHGFNIPAVRLITEVDPGAVRSVWIQAPQQPGKYLIQCVDYCGIGHHQMKAWLVVKAEAAAAPGHAPRN